MTLPRHLVPRQLRVIAEHIGEDAMLKLWAEFGGVHLRIPTLERIPAGHKLVEILGHDAMRLCHHYGGECLSIPKAARAKQALRNKAMREARSQGQSHASIAREHDLTERQVIRICMMPMELDIDFEDTQEDLFECRTSD